MENLWISAEKQHHLKDEHFNNIEKNKKDQTFQNDACDTEYVTDIKQIVYFDRVKDSKIHVENDTIISLNKGKPNSTYKIIKNLGCGSFGNMIKIEIFYRFMNISIHQTQCTL